MSFDLKHFFMVTDKMSATAFKDFFHNDATWTFGNMPMMQGREAIANMADSFFQQLISIKHEVNASIESKDLIMFEGFVSYHLKNKPEIISLPFACSIRLNKEKIICYRTYIDITPLG
jgi:limonene-1,2-epoxide hydrolase